VPDIVDPPLTVVDPPANVVPPPRPAATAPASSRPEIAIGGAFAGGLLASLILKRLAR
jgi:hypothetical protein